VGCIGGASPPIIGAPACRRQRPSRAAAASDADRCSYREHDAGPRPASSNTTSPFEVAVRYKRATLDNFAALATLISRHLPELGEQALRVCGLAVLVTGAIWTHSRPSASVLAAYETDPALAAWRLDFTTALEETLATLISGVLARAGA
jgi:hypothetical protein